MSDDRGLLGSLPKTRPGVESPRRVAARESAARDAAEAPRPDAEEPVQRSSGFEDLARAGIGLAGGAAALGLRLAGRTAGEIGKAVGRR